MFKKEEEKEVVVFNPGVVSFSDDIKKFFQQELSSDMENVTPRLPNIKIMRETQQFKFPDESLKTEFVGIILDSCLTKAYWKDSFTGENNPPDCASLDAINPSQGDSPISKSCTTCKLNRFGTAIDDKTGDKMRGKACKDLRRIHVLLDGYKLPFRMTLTPSSLKGYDNYISDLQTKGYPLLSVKTLFSLDKADSSGFTVSIFHGESHSFIADSQEEFTEKFLLLKRMKSDFRTAMRGQEILKSEYSVEETSNEAEVPEAPIETEPSKPGSKKDDLPF